VVDITEAALTALTDAHSDGGIEPIGNGYYRLDLPDAAVADGASGVLVEGTVTGMIVIGNYITLVDYDPFDGVRLGLTALPDAAADAAGGLPVSDAGGLALDVQAASVAAIEADTAAMDTANELRTLLTGGTLALSTFAAASDAVANVTTVSTVTNAVVTDAASRTASQADVSGLATTAGLGSLQTHGDSTWSTATGFSTHSAADVWTAANRALSVPSDYKADVSGLATAAALGQVAGDVTDILADTAALDGRLTVAWAGQLDAAISTRLAASGYTAPDNAGIAAEVDIVLTAGHGAGSWTGAPLSGTIGYRHTVTRTDTGAPVPNARVEVFTEAARLNLVAMEVTDDFGRADFSLTGGTYYLWNSKAGYSFENPEVVSVAAP